MTSRLKADESPRKGLRRITRGQIDKAREELVGAGPSGDAVHAVRKRLKRLRALLRLAGDGMDEATYRREMARFRDAARPLSEVRDAEVLVEAFDGLIATSGGGGHPDEAATARAALVGRREGATHGVLDHRSTIDDLAAQLDRAREGLDGHAFAGVRWSTLREGLSRIYRKGRRAFREAVESPTDENLHEWRKRVKDLGYALAVVEPIRPGFARRRVALADELADVLGDDHDLAVLRMTLLGPTMPAASATPFLPAIDARRAGLRDHAFEIGRKVYPERTSAFADRLDAAWLAWRSRVGAD